MQSPQHSDPLSAPAQLPARLRRVAYGMGRMLLLIPRLLAVAVSLALWLCLLPLWALMLVRTVMSFSLLNVLSCFAGTGPADPQRIDRVAKLWPQGVAAICEVLTGNSEPRPVAVLDQVRVILTETGAFVVVVGTLVVAHFALSLATGPFALLAAGVLRSFSSGATCS